MLVIELSRRSSASASRHRNRKIAGSIPRHDTKSLDTLGLVQERNPLAYRLERASVNAEFRLLQGLKQTEFILFILCHPLNHYIPLDAVGESQRPHYAKKHPY